MIIALCLELSNFVVVFLFLCRHMHQQYFSYDVQERQLWGGNYDIPCGHQGRCFDWLIDGWVHFEYFDSTLLNQLVQIWCKLLNRDVTTGYSGVFLLLEVCTKTSEFLRFHLKIFGWTWLSCSLWSLFFVVSEIKAVDLVCFSTLIHSQVRTHDYQRFCLLCPDCVRLLLHILHLLPEILLV